jgi:signal transduction histidine kinase
MPWADAFPFRQRPDLTFGLVSPPMEELTGVPAIRWQREPGLLLQLVEIEDAEVLKTRINRCAKSVEPIAHTFRLRHARTGRVAHVVEWRRALRDACGELCGYEGLWLDITWHALPEQRLASATWKEALSHATLGLAHDFNNALTGILSLSEHFLSQIDAQHPFHEGLWLIRQNSQRAAQLAHRLMRLHHDKPGTRDFRDLNALAADAFDLLRCVIPKRIDLTSQWVQTPLPVEVDAVECQRVIIYLALNAAEAIADRGRIHLETSLHRELPSLGCFVGRAPRPPAACLSVADSGAGIKAENLPRAFEPFFTTKPAENAAGLGLYHASQFAQASGGAVAVESAEGVGSTFRVWLPWVDMEQDAPKA